MNHLDYIALFLFFIVMVIIGFASYSKVKNSDDFFTAGGNVPWWLAGISHHVSGYSGAVFVGYALICYKYGITIYFWWAIPITLSCMVGAFLIAPKWARLRAKVGIQSPTEYLSIRYNVATQQVMAWAGVLLKLFDVAAKFTAMGILLNGFTGLPIYTGIIISGAVSLLYITIGGLWADLWTDLAQFIVQLIAGLVMFAGVLIHLGGIDQAFKMWSRLPEGNLSPFNGPYTSGFMLAFVLITFLSYNGGTWNLATRYISAPSGESAKRSALLSASLYLIWPLILFFPMWASPLLFPEIADPSTVYSALTFKFIPNGLIGIVLASMFANTLSMTTSDTNTISAVITRDILPVLNKKFVNVDEKKALFYARVSTLLFTLATLTISMNSHHFGGVLGLLITWFGALLGPTAIPMILGLMPQFKSCDSKIALLSIFSGLGGFVLVNFIFQVSQAVKVATPLTISLIVFIGLGYLNRNAKVPDEVEELLHKLKSDESSEIEVEQKSENIYIG